MNQALNCNQFIQGKLIGGNVYEIVARTADLTNPEQLSTIVETCQLLFAESPNDTSQTKAIGIFCHEENIVLVQVTYAIDAKGQFMTDAFSRPFHQYRYVLVPIHLVVKQLQGRTFRLLSWISKQAIPLFTKQEKNLLFLDIPLLEEDTSQDINQQKFDRDVEQIQRCLTETDAQGQPLLLSAVAALLNQQQILIDSVSEAIPPEIYLKSILLLLPANLRRYVSVAMGSLKEENCGWAKLIIKFNGSPQMRKLPENFLWLNRHTKKLEGEIEQDTLSHEFVNDILDPIAKATDRIPELLKRLDTITDDTGTLENPSYPEIVVRLIPALPENLQEQVWSKWLQKLETKDKWKHIIQLINSQRGLLAAWKKLAIKLATVERAKPQTNILLKGSEICELMQQIWMRLTSNTLISILQELQHNITLAEKLLEMKCIQWSHFEAESTEEIGLLRILCKKVVAQKSQQNLEQGWKLATHLATDNIFREPKESFLLLDANFSVNSPVQHLYNSFNLKLALLFPDLENATILESQWYQQLECKNPEVARLLKRLFSQKNENLKNLQKLAQLTEMEDGQKDSFYEAFLRKWSPSFEEARDLLASILHNLLQSEEKLSYYHLEKTYQWFENKKSKLRDIFENLQQETIAWSSWNQLTNAIYENPQDCAEFLDRAVGKIFPTQVVSKWMPIITNEKNLRQKFLEKSLAWQALEPKDLIEILSPSPQYAATLTRCCRDSKRCNWIKGDLLHYLCYSWTQQKQIDEDLKPLITSPTLVDSFTKNDWWELQQLRWRFKFDLGHLFKKITLTDELKEVIFNQGLSIINNCTEFKDRQSVFDDCVAWGLSSEQLKYLAIKVLQTYSHPEQTQILLTTCKAQNFSYPEQKEIIKQAPLQACSVSLIRPYLYHEGKVIKPVRECDLVQLFLKTRLRNKQEIADLANFSIDVFIDSILPDRDLETLRWWREQVPNENIKFYKQAFSRAAQIYAKNLTSNQFYEYICRFKKYSLKEESRLILQAYLDWIPDGLLQPIVDGFIQSKNHLN